MKKILCKILGHRYKIRGSTKMYVYCKRCGADVIKYALKRKPKNP